MKAMRGRRGRWIGAGAALAAAVAVGAVAGLRPPDQRPVASGAAGPASEGPPPVGPVIYYEVLDADGSHLMERRLDGRSLARTVATRADVDYGRTWTVDPTASVAIALIPDTTDQALEAISVATGAALWSTRTPPSPIDRAAWSPDGARLGLTVGGDVGPRDAIVIDAATGQSRSAAVPDDAVVQGFDAAGGLVLRQRAAPTTDAAVAWHFLRFDPGTGSVTRPAIAPDVGSLADGPEDVHPAAGFGVDIGVAPNDQGSAIRAWPLRGGPSRILTTLPSVDRIAIDPGGTGVALSAAQTVRFVTFDGHLSELFSGPDPIADFAWSGAGDYLAVATDRRGPNLTIIERATGRTVELPHPDAVAQLLLVRIVGGLALPASPLPPSEPVPSPTLGPSGVDVVGFGGLVSGWVEPRGDALIVRVQRLVPTEGGGLRVAADMPPLDLGPALDGGGGPELRLLPRPGSDDVLIWIADTDRLVGWLWDGAAGLHLLDLPKDWPANAYDPAWSPDGGAIAASAGRALPNGDIEGTFVIATVGGASTTVVPVVGAYDRLEGWWTADELRVGHGICLEGCAGRYAMSARLRIRDHRLVQMTAAERAHAPIDETTVDPAGSIVLSFVNDDPADDVVITWPEALGRADRLDVVGFGGDGRSLLVVQRTAIGSDLYRIDDPVGRATRGRLDDPRPVRLVHLDARGIGVAVAPDDAWATVTDRVDNVRLVRLSDGRSWPLDRDRTLVWAAPR